jgi:hypothetical protein
MFENCTVRPANKMEVSVANDSLSGKNEKKNHSHYRQRLLDLWLYGRKDMGTFVVNGGLKPKL